MKMKKILTVLAVLVVLLLGACSKQSTPDIVGGGSVISADNPPPAPKEDLGQNGASGDTIADDVKEFQITAKQFSFEPGTIEVNKGDKVRLIVTSMDVPHGFAIKEYGINERLDVGKPVTIEFTADKEGTFTAFCSVACGAGHSNMKGQLIVR